MSEILWNSEAVKKATNQIEDAVSVIDDTTEKLHSEINEVIENSSGKWGVIEATAAITTQMKEISQKITDTTETINAALKAYDEGVADADDASGIKAIAD